MVITQLHIYIIIVYYSIATAGLIISWLYNFVLIYILTQPNALTALLEYIDVFNLGGSVKTNIWAGLLALYLYILLFKYIKLTMCI